MDRGIKEDLYKKSCALPHGSSDSTLYQAGVKNELKSLCRRDSGFPLCSCSHRLGGRLCRSASLCREPSWSAPGSSCGDAGLNGRYDLQVHAMAALEREVAKDRERQAICIDYSLAVRFPQGDDGEVAGPCRDTASQGTAKSADVLDGRAVRGDHQGVRAAASVGLWKSPPAWPISFLCFCDWLVERLVLDQHKPECPLCGAPPEAGQRYCDSCYKELGLGE